MAVKDLRLWFLLWLTAMVIMLSLPAEGRSDGPLYEGTCAGGEPAPAQPDDFAAWACVHLNGQRLQNPYHDAYPYVDTAGEVLVPLRLAAEAMGGEVAWVEAGAQTVTLTWRGRTAALTIGEHEARVGGERILLDRAPVLWRQRTMVTPDTVARLFGARVTYDARTHQVLVRRGGVFCAERFCKKR